MKQPPSQQGLQNTPSKSLQRFNPPSKKKVSRYDIKPSDGKASILEI